MPASPVGHGILHRVGIQTPGTADLCSRVVVRSGSSYPGSKCPNILASKVMRAHSTAMPFLPRNIVSRSWDLSTTVSSLILAFRSSNRANLYGVGRDGFENHPTG